MQGIIKSFSKSVQGYGFITAEDQDYFFHITEWQEEAPPIAGEKVDFVPTETGKGMRALLVRRL